MVYIGYLFALGVGALVDFVSLRYDSTYVQLAGFVFVICIVAAVLNTAGSAIFRKQRSLVHPLATALTISVAVGIGALYSAGLPTSGVPASDFDREIVGLIAIFLAVVGAMWVLDVILDNLDASSEGGFFHLAFGIGALLIMFAFTRSDRLETVIVATVGVVCLALGPILDLMLHHRRSISPPPTHT